MSEPMSTLERRTHLAADLAVAVDRNTIRLTASDALFVTVEPAGDDTIRVYVGGVDATIGGNDVSKRFRLQGRRGIHVDFANTTGGNVDVRDVLLPGRVFVEGAGGELGGTAVTFYGSSAAGVTVRSAGEANVDVSRSSVRGNLEVSAARGRADLKLTDSAVRKNLRFDHRGGDSATVEVANSHVKGTTSEIASAGGIDDVIVRDSRFDRRLAIRTGDARDSVLLENSRFGTDVDVDDGAGLDTIETRIRYDFNRDAQGWSTGFADYEGAELEDPTAAHGPLPANIGGAGWRLGATNRADDTVAYLTKRIGRREGLVAGTPYQVSYDVRFASNARSGSFGIGGAEGESVFLKVGASTEPLTTSGEKNRLNIDVGDQSESGGNATNTGNIANGREIDDQPAEEAPYVKMSRQATHAFPIATAADGSLHLFVGTESGYEGRTVVLYRRIDVTLRALR